MSSHIYFSAHIRVRSRTHAAGPGNRLQSLSRQAEAFTRAPRRRSERRGPHSLSPRETTAAAVSNFFFVHELNTPDYK